uniref:protein-tyrosine-phosphatase n=2 Tax=Cacopsylla melanoneura TaxID=428564 RepID=A0A8D8VBZ0_9HEMI
MVILAVILAVFVCILTVWAGDYRVSKNEDGLYTVQYNPEDYSYGPTLAPTSHKRKVLIVCLTNLARSPIAESVFRKMIKRRRISDQWEVSSAAAFYWEEANNDIIREALHVIGKIDPDYDEIKRIHAQKTRQIPKDAFRTNDFILAVDEMSYNATLEKRKEWNEVFTKAQVMHFDKLDPMKISNRWFALHDHNFTHFYQRCERAIQAFDTKVNSIM